MDKSKTAVIIGHSECREISEAAVKTAVEQLINSGVTLFLSGEMGGFDRLCAGAIHRIKKIHPEICSDIVIPYLSFRIFERNYFDHIIYPEGFEKYYFKAVIPARNAYMVRNSGFALCYINHGWGGAAQTYRQAVKKNLHIINLGTLPVSNV